MLARVERKASLGSGKFFCRYANGMTAQVWLGEPRKNGSLLRFAFRPIACEMGRKVMVEFDENRLTVKSLLEGVSCRSSENENLFISSKIAMHFLIFPRGLVGHALSDLPERFAS